MGYRRVSRQEPCAICLKPDWCSTTVFRDISFCARSIRNANRVSSRGWGVYYQGGDASISVLPNLPAKSAPVRRAGVNLASIEVRDKVYRTLIELSPVDAGIPKGSDWLANRGIREASRFGYLPGSVKRRDSLLKLLVGRLSNPKKISSNAFRGVPGFWTDLSGVAHLGSRANAIDGLLLVPFFDSNSLIQACQIRLMRQPPDVSTKYLWLSSSKEREGCGPGTPLHHEGARGLKGKFINTVLVTEGALKATAVQTFLPDRYVVGNSGVTTSHEEIVKTARRKILEIAFDSDSFTNPHVARAVASLVALRIREQRFLSYDNHTEILAWDKRFKGIDDALIAGATLKHLTVSEWLTSLTPDCFDAARHQLVGISL